MCLRVKSDTEKRIAAAQVNIVQRQVPTPRPGLYNDRANEREPQPAADRPCHGAHATGD